MSKLSLRALCLVLALLMLASACIVSAEPPKAAKLATNVGPYEILISNITNASITELYIFPSYSSSLGQARNTSWIYTGTSGKVSVTALEAQRNTLWNFQLNFRQGSYFYYIRWEDLDLNDLLGYHIIVEVLADGSYNLRYADDDPTVYSNWFYVLNDSGRVITEIYIYANGSSRWGSVRNSRQIGDGGQTTVSLTNTELASSYVWNLRIGFDYGSYVSYVEWEDIDLRSYLGGTMQVSRYTNGGYYIQPYNRSF